MNSARFVSRRPVYRCLNAPRPIQQLRHITSVPRSIPRVDNNGGFTRPIKRRLPDVNEISTHRAEMLRHAQFKKKQYWLAAGAAASMLATILTVKVYDAMYGLPEDKGAEDVKGEKKDKDSQSWFHLIKSPPAKTDSPRAAAAQFQGKQVVIGAGDKILAAPAASAEHPSASDPGAIELVETGSSYVPYFPKTIMLPASPSPEGPEGVKSAAEAEYTLLGLGIRKVSFLRVQVYVVGLYVKTSSLSTLQNHLINTVNPTASALILNEKEELRKALLDGEKSTAIWESILSRQGIDGVEMALRVVPTRGTDFNHLRDGLMRGIQGRTDQVGRRQTELLRQQAAESKTISLPKPVEESEFADESFGLAMKEFKALFGGRGNASKGSVLLFARDQAGALSVMYQPLTKTKQGEKAEELLRLGTVNDDRVSRLLWLLYLGGPTVSSEPARQNIVEGCIGIVERPVGTVEGMVQ